MSDNTHTGVVAAQLAEADAETLEAIDDSTPDPSDIDWGPTRKPLENGEPCPECGHSFDADAWDVRHINGPSLGESWLYTCPNCEQETAEVGT